MKRKNRRKLWNTQKVKNRPKSNFLHRFKFYWTFKSINFLEIWLSYRRITEITSRGVLKRKLIQFSGSFMRNSNRSCPADVLGAVLWCENIKTFSGVHSYDSNFFTSSFFFWRFLRYFKFYVSYNPNFCTDVFPDVRRYLQVPLACVKIDY